MANRYVTAAGIAGMAALAAWVLLQSRSKTSRLSALPNLEVDDDTAADIIRRFAPTLTYLTDAQRAFV